jgi:hypothetical protein
MIYSGASPPPRPRTLANSFRHYCRLGLEFRLGAQPMLQRLSLRTAHVLPNEIRVLGDCLRAHLFLLMARVKVNRLYLMQIAKVLLTSMHSNHRSPAPNRRTQRRIAKRRKGRSGHWAASLFGSVSPRSGACMTFQV